MSGQTESSPAAGGAGESKQQSDGSGQSQRTSGGICHHNSDTWATGVTGGILQLDHQTDMVGMYHYTSVERALEL